MAPSRSQRTLSGMRYLRGYGAATGIFAASFALHIVGGATNQDWLFGTAVGLIYLSATGFPVIAWLASGGRPNERLMVGVGMVAGFGLTVSALWAANDRALAGWLYPLGLALLLTTSSLLYGCWLLWQNWRGAGMRSGEVAGQ